jgi:hypothetical protein
MQLLVMNMGHIAAPINSQEHIMETSGLTSASAPHPFRHYFNRSLRYLPIFSSKLFSVMCKSILAELGSAPTAFNFENASLRLLDSLQRPMVPVPINSNCREPL